MSVAIGDRHDAVRLRLRRERDIPPVGLAVHDDLDHSRARGNQHRLGKNDAVMPHLTGTESRSIWKDHRQPHVGGVAVTVLPGGGDTVATG